MSTMFDGGVPAHNYQPGDKVIYSGPLGGGEEREMTVESAGWGNDTWNCVFPGGGGRYGGENLRPANAN